MSIFFDVRSRIVDASLVGRRVFRPDQVEKPTYPFVDIEEGETTPSDIPGWEVRQLDVNVYLRKSDDPDLPRQIAALFRRLRINNAIFRVESIHAEDDNGVSRTVIELVARVPIDA